MRRSVGVYAIPAVAAAALGAGYWSVKHDDGLRQERVKACAAVLPDKQSTIGDAPEECDGFGFKPQKMVVTKSGTTALYYLPSGEKFLDSHNGGRRSSEERLALGALVAGAIALGALGLGMAVE